MKRLAIALTLRLLNSRAFYPKQTLAYDSKCDTTDKQLTLQTSTTYMRIARCENEACIAALLAIPKQALVAGSVVIAGNTVYGLEKEGRCLLKDSSTAQNNRSAHAENYPRQPELCESVTI